MPHIKIETIGSWTPENAYERGAAVRQSDKTTAHYEVSLAVWRDPFTLPHTGPIECVKVCEGPFGWKYCCEYAAKCQFMYVRALLIVDFAKPGNFAGIVQECHDMAVAAGLVSAIVTAFMTGGTGAAKAAVDTYIAAVTSCMASKASEALLSVRVEFPSWWGDWENCA